LCPAVRHGETSINREGSGRGLSVWQGGFDVQAANLPGAELFPGTRTARSTQPGETAAMKSVFNNNLHPEEPAGIHHQTTPIANWPNDVSRLAWVVSVIRTHFVEAENWRCEVPHTKGSVTLRHMRDEKLVVKVFIDDECRLARHEGYDLDPDQTPIVVGIELTHLSPYERDVIRRDLRQRFRGTYMDPEAGRPKTALVPQNDHCYDIIFLWGPGCDLEVDEESLAETEAMIRRAVFGQTD